MRRWALIAVLAFVACGEQQPEAIPWAWERREDLRFLGPRAIAHYAGIIELRGERTEVTPRLNPLLIDPGATRIAVVRIETRRPALTTAQREEAIRAILRLAGDAPALQIDFDAVRSERAFYGELLVALRARTKATLSMTALASWCMDDRWLASLPVDEIVPMFFRMGRESASIRERVARGQPLPEPRCNTSIGISTDEPFAHLPPVRRVWIFNPKPWTPNDWSMP